MTCICLKYDTIISFLNGGCVKRKFSQSYVVSLVVVFSIIHFHSTLPFLLQSSSFFFFLLQPLRLPHLEIFPTTTTSSPPSSSPISYNTVENFHNKSFCKPPNNHPSTNDTFRPPLLHHLSLFVPFKTSICSNITLKCVTILSKNVSG